MSVNLDFTMHDHLRYFLYEDIGRALDEHFRAKPTTRLQVLDFGSRWYGDPDGGWQSGVRWLLKSVIGQASFEHVLAEYPQYDIQDLVVDDGAYDIVVADQVLEHVQRPWRAASELARVVKAGGLTVVATPGLYPIHPSPLDCWRLMPDAYAVLFPPSHWRWLTMSAWGNKERVGYEYWHKHGFPDGPPQTSVVLARTEPGFTPVFDGRCPLQVWLVAERTSVPGSPAGL